MTLICQNVRSGLFMTQGATSLDSRLRGNDGDWGGGNDGGWTDDDGSYETIIKSKSS